MSNAYPVFFCPGKTMDLRKVKEVNKLLVIAQVDFR